MKRTMNITTSYFDLPRYLDNTDLKQGYGQFGLDGLELMVYGDDEQGIIRPDDVVGSHLVYFHHWLPLMYGDEDAVLAEYGDWDTVEMVFGGRGREAIVAAFRENTGLLAPYSPAYAVTHVSDVTIQGSITRQHPYTDAQVVAAQIELANAVFDDPGWGVTLLFENLWWPGLTMLDPDLTYGLLEGVAYPDCGVMLDIGHLLCTNLELKTPDEGIDFIHQALDRYDDLGFIKGVHLHQTLSGQYAQGVIERPFTVDGDYGARSLGVQQHVLTLDSHRPFVSERIADLIARIDPEYLTLELISTGREEHEQMLAEQMACL
jgi:hypothetical protein